MLEQEITILKQVNHAHIIHLQEVYDTSKVSAAFRRVPQLNKAQFADGFLCDACQRVMIYYAEAARLFADVADRLRAN